EYWPENAACRPRPDNHRETTQAIQKAHVFRPAPRGNTTASAAPDTESPAFEPTRLHRQYRPAPAAQARHPSARAESAPARNPASSATDPAANKPGWAPHHHAPATAPGAP